MNWKRILAGAMSLALISPLVTPLAIVRADSSGTEEEKNYIVVVEDGAFSAAQFFMGEDAEIVETTQNKNYFVVPMTEAEAAALSMEEDVISVEEDIIVTAMSDAGEEDWEDVIPLPKAPARPEEYEWNLKAIHATPDELDMYPTDESLVRVAILDSGIGVCEDLDVEEYVNLVQTEQHVTDYNQDVTGHGTGVAGLLAGNVDDTGIVGVAPDVTMYSVKVFDQINEAPISRIIEGIYWAIDNDIHIINMSFGTDVNSYALHRAIQDAENAGILMVAAAGNHGFVEYPAAYPEVIAVGATDYEGKRAEFSATGQALELVAPGKSVLTDSFYGGTMALDGTSLSAPQVAGAAAVLWAKDMSKSSDFIRQLLNASANRSIGTGEEYGNGLLDVRHAFEIYDDFEESYVPGVFEYAGIAENTEPYVAGDEPGYVVGSWSSTQHNASIEQGTEEEDKLYTEKRLRYMQQVSAFLDVPMPAGESIENKRNYFSSNEINSNFHGGKNLGSSSRRETTNYVGDVILLYQLAIALKGMGKNSSLKAQQDMVDDVIANVTEETSYVPYKEFPGRIKKLLETSIPDGEYTNQTSVEANTYKILGAALHMAGDVYAHRSMVPRNSINNTDAKSLSNADIANQYKLAHFGTGEECSNEEIEEKIYNALTDKVEDKEKCKTGDGNPAKSCKDRTWECYANGVRRGFMEFKDIANFMVKGIEKPRSKYEDNAKFYKERFSIGTNYTIQYIMNKFRTNKALDGNIFLPGENGNSYAIPLNALKILYKQLNFFWDEVNWTNYTTKYVR